MKTKLLAFLLPAGLFFIACENPKAKQDKLQAEVLAQHDVVMARMDEINESQTTLAEIKANFKNIPNADTLALQKTIDSLKGKLKEADDAMMDWMHNFNPDYEGMSHEQVMEYLGKQHIAIDSVQILFEQSLSKSKEITSKYKQ